MTGIVGDGAAVGVGDGVAVGVAVGTGEDAGVGTAIGEAVPVGTTVTSDVVAGSAPEPPPQALNDSAVDNAAAAITNLRPTGRPDTIDAAF